MVDVTLRFVCLGLGLSVVVFYYVWLVVCVVFALRWFCLVLWLRLFDLCCFSLCRLV